MDKALENQIKEFMAQALAEGKSLSDIQNEVNSNFDVNLTYMDVRILASTLEVDWKALDPNKKAETPEQEVPAADDAAEAENSIPAETAAPADELSGSTTVELNTIRTWLYCKDVDNNYADLVTARNDYFATRGMTAQTHFITSTGIEGQCGDPHRVVRMDSLTVSNLKREQIQFLYALENLSPTAIYGVSFERGTRLIWGDRSHCLISGTASIDKAGIVLHVGDVRLQTRRMMENIRALLAEGNAEISDIKWGTLYLRDMVDAPIVLEELARAGIPADMPLVTLKAPVCRPTWLVEMECVAVKKENNPYPVLG